MTQEEYIALQNQHIVPEKYVRLSTVIELMNNICQEYWRNQHDRETEELS